MEFAIIKGGKVIDRIVSDKPFAGKYAKGLGGTVSEAHSAQVGFKKSGSNWVDDRAKVKAKAEPVRIQDELNKLSDAQKVKIVNFLTTL